MEHEASFDDKGKVKPKTDLTPAKRFSFLVGEHESAYTACKQLLPLLEADIADPSLQDIENAFSIEKVTDEFFQQYKELYIKLSEHLKTQSLFQSGTEEEQKQKVTRFSKKLLGQIVFLYFLQKKGWLGVAKDQPWGKGDKKFLSNRYRQTTNNYYADFLQYLFYEALAQEREKDGYYPHFECKIPFLNGGLFEADYDWKHEPVEIPDTLFRNTEKNKAGDTGTGILDVFDRYNFTIKEDEPLEKEVAVDPEMLGKVFENMLEVIERKNKGAFYTPREIVHYMCQESLIQYLYQAVQFIPKSDLETFIRNGHLFLENDALAIQAEQKITSGELKSTTHNSGLPDSIHEHADLLDEKLTSIKICDPAIGSGAFSVGLLHEIVTARLTLQSITGSDVNAYELKRHCIQESIYGVDIDVSAIDISRLRLWLSLIVDESDYDTITALPNLDYKIMQGNSLVEDFEGIQLFNDEFINLHDEAEIEITRLKEQQATLQQQFIALYKDKLLTSEKKHELEKQNKALIQKIKKLQTSLINQDTQLDMNDLDIISVAKIKAEKLEKLHKVFFSACTPVKKAEIRQQISTLEWELIEATLKERKQTEALEKIQALKQSNEKPFFLWKLNFPEVFKQHGGFDVVIGNPPYIKEYSNRSAFDGVRHSPYYQGKMDLWYLFACHSLDLLKNNSGILAFIATNNWTTNFGASKMRNKFIQGATIKQLIDFGSGMVFKSADIQTMIMLVKKGEAEDNYNLDYRRINVKHASFNDALDLLLKKHTEKNEILQPVIIKSDLINKELTFTNNKIDSVLKKILQQGDLFLEKNEVANGIHPHHDYVNKKSQQILGNGFFVGQGIFVLTGDEKEALDLSNKELQLLKPYYTTKQLSRWSGNPKNVEWIIYTTSKFNKIESIYPYPHLKEHLDQFSEVITSDNKPYGLHRAREESFFKGEKITALRKCVGMPRFTYTNFDCYVSATFYIIKTNRVNQKYLTALLNSKLIAFWLKYKGKMQGNNYQIDKEPILSIPIKNIPKKSYVSNFFDCLVDFILLVKESELKLQTAYFEQIIDGLVFELYFTEEIDKANKPLLKHLGDLKPITEDMGKEEKLAIIKHEFDRLYDPGHLVRNHLETLGSIEEIRIIKEALQ